MRSAWMKAGMKMGLGFSVVGAVLGIRVVSVAPAVDSSELAGDGPVPDVRAVERIQIAEDDANVSAEESSIDGATTAIRETLAGSGAADSRPGDRMVSCRIRGSTQFMTADDCATRGGRSTLFESDR